MNTRSQKYHLFCFILICLLLLFLQSCEINLNEVDEPETASTKVAILGTFHFAGTGDVAAVEVDSIMSEQRQEEIDTLLNQIADFQPDKVLVEMISSKQDSLMQNYRAYRKDQFDLTSSEIDQLGMKLAKRLGHDSIYAADYMLHLPFEELIDFSRRHEMEQRLEGFFKQVKDQATKDSDFLKSHSLREYFIKLNSEQKTRENRNYYLNEMMKYSRDTLYPGPELSGEWFKRNLYILANMDRIIEPGDRALFIVGVGHKAILEEFIQSRKDMQYIEIREYLLN